MFDEQGMFGDIEVASVKMAVFGEDNNFSARASESRLLFTTVAGAPFGEPIIPYGPLVMNRREETQQALTDLRDWTFVRK